MHFILKYSPLDQNFVGGFIQKDIDKFYLTK